MGPVCARKHTQAEEVHEKAGKACRPVKAGNGYSIYIQRQAKKDIVVLTGMGWHACPVAIETAGWQDWCLGVHGRFGARMSGRDELSHPCGVCHSEHQGDACQGQAKSGTAG